MRSDQQPLSLASGVPAPRATTSFLGSVALLAGSSGVAQIIPVLASPILARLFTPENFGTFSVYLASVTTLIVIASLKYDAAIPLPKSDQEAADLAGLALLCTLGVFGITSATGWALKQPLIARFDPGAIKLLTILVPIGLLIAGVFQVANMWAIRQKQFKSLSIRTLLQTSTGTAFQIAGGALLAGPLMLMVGHAAGQAVGTLSLLRQSWKHHSQSFQAVTWRGMKAVALRYIRFPKFTVGSSLLNKISVNLPVFGLAYLFDLKTAGLFGLTLRVAITPMHLVTTAVSQVFFARASQAHQSGQLAKVTDETLNLLTNAGIPIVFAITSGAPLLFPPLFGAEWSPAGTYTQLLGPWLLLLFLSTPISTLTFVREQQQHELLFQLILFSGRLLALALGYHFGSALLAIAFYAAASTIIWLGYFIWLVLLSGNSLTAVLLRALKVGVRTTLLYLPFFLALLLTEGILIQLICWACSAAASLALAASALRTLSRQSLNS